MENQEKRIIVAFHIGRGGHFNNANHLSFCGERDIQEFTDNFFLSYENEAEVLAKVKHRDNLEALYYAATENDDNEALERLKRYGLDLGEKCYTDHNGNNVLSLAEYESGIGRIDIDGEYDTTYTCYIEDCNERELELIREDKRFSLSYELKSYIESEAN